MKKIVGILAAAAVLATSVFAADVSAKVKLDGKLLNVDTTKEKDGVSAVSIGHNTDESWNPVLKMAVSGDNYGASVDIYVGAWDATKMGEWNHGYGLGAREWNIWFKPIDVLKIQVGRINENVNQESIDYDTRLWNYDDQWGYKLEFNFSGFEFNVGFHQGQGEYWFSQAENGDAVIKGLSVLGAYNADFGRIAAFADFKDTFETIFVGAGYNNQFGDLRIFADAGFKTAKNYKFALKNKWGNKVTVKDADGKDKDVEVTLKDAFFVGGDVDVKYNKDAFGVEAYAKLDMLLSYKDRVADFDNEKENGTALFFKTKVTYAFDPCTVYFYFKDTNLLSSTFAADIRLGANGSVGSATWDVCGKIETGKGGANNAITAGNKVNFSIPVSFAVAF